MIIERVRGIGIEAEERTGRATALPASAHEVAALVRLAAGEGWIVAPEWLPADGLLRESVGLSLERLNSVEEVAPQDFLAVAGAGVTAGSLEDSLAGRGLYWPGSEGASSDQVLGDIVTRAPGNWSLIGNVIRRYVLAVEAVLADGTVVRTGSRTVKCVTGYDLKQLFTGSWGTLGVVTGLTLRLEATANRQAVRERYAGDFPGLERARAGRFPESVRGDRGAEPGAGDGSLVVLDRLKKELDPSGVFPPVTAVGSVPARALSWPGPSRGEEISG